ncbi:hypothetical protein Tsubulata_020244, partial [Turnera subulata]
MNLPLANPVTRQVLKLPETTGFRPFVGFSGIARIPNTGELKVALYSMDPKDVFVTTVGDGGVKKQEIYRHMADSRSFSSSPKKKEPKLDHEPGLLHHAAAHLGAISSSASKQEADSVPGDAVSGPEVEDDPMMNQEEEEYGDGPEEKAHHDDSTLADDDNKESDSQADDESDADKGGDARSSIPDVGVRRSIKNDEHMAIYDECERQREKSEGFDIDVDPNLTDKLPKWLHNNMCRPIRVDDESLAPILEEMGHLACEFANSNQSEPHQLEFFKVVKANYNGMGLSFYITFAAVDKFACKAWEELLRCPKFVN